VLALSARAADLPPNVRVRTFGAPTQALRGGRFLAVLAPALARRPAALLAHMSPVYALLAAPLARTLRVRVLLWYTQWRTNPVLERATSVADAVLTVDAESFPFGSPKVRAIGHGIDLSRFACAEPPGRATPELLALGRYSPVKGYPELIEALREVDARLVIRGSTENEGERAHEREIGRLAESSGGRVVAAGPAAPAEVPALLAASDALVSGTRGGADKVVLEAGASCVPAFSPAPAFASLLPEELRYDADLPDKLRAFAALDGPARARLGRELRARVEREHSVERWADRVVEAARR